MNPPSRIALMLCLLHPALLLQTPPLLHAAERYPSKPIRLIVPFAPGGGADYLGRTIGQELSRAWGQQVVVDNRAGAGTMIGTEVAVQSPHDGYTLLMVNIGLVLNPALRERMPYDAGRDLAPVARLASLPTVLAVHPSLPANSIKELVALSKSKVSSLNYGSSGNGSNGHIAGETFKIATGGDFVHVPYKGGSLVARDAIAGHIHIAFISLPSVMPHMKAGKLRVLAITDSKRSSLAPDLPTISETVPGVQVDNWLGMLVPRGTSPSLVSQINADVVRAMQAPEVRKRLAIRGFAVETSTPSEFSALIQTEIVKYKRIVQKTGIRAN